MKRNCAFMFVSAIFCGMFLFTSASMNRMLSFTGVIEYYGNAPFERPAFVTDDGKIFSMAAAPNSDFTMKDILALQGHKLELTGKIEKSDFSTFGFMKDGNFLIYSYKDMSAGLDEDSGV